MKLDKVSTYSDFAGSRPNIACLRSCWELSISLDTDRWRLVAGCWRLVGTVAAPTQR
jgi:hypothetical protein